MDEKLKALLEEARSKGANESQLQTIVNSYKTTSTEPDKPKGVKPEVSGDSGFTSGKSDSSSDIDRIKRIAFEKTLQSRGSAFNLKKPEILTPQQTAKREVENLSANIQNQSVLNTLPEEDKLRLKNEATKKLSDEYTKAYKDSEVSWSITDSMIDKEAVNLLRKEQDKELYENTDMWEQAWLKFKSGGARALGGISGIPNWLNKTLYTNFLASDEELEALNKMSPEQREVVINTIMGSPITPQGQLGLLSAESQNYMKEVAKGIEEDIVVFNSSIGEDFSNGNWGRGISRIFTEGAGSAPSIVQAMIPYVGIPSIVAGEISNKQEELEDEGFGLGGDTTLNSIVSGSAEGLFEIVTKKLGGKLLKAFKDAPEYGKKEILTSLRDVLMSSVEEGSSESMTSIVQNLSDILIQGKDADFDKVFKEAVDAYLIGGTMGGGFSLSTNTINKVKEVQEEIAINRVLKSDSNEFTEISDAFSTEIKKTTLDQLKIVSRPTSQKRLEDNLNNKLKRGEITEKEATDIKQNYLNTFEAVKSTKGIKMNAKNRVKAVNLISEKVKLKQEIKNMDDALAKPKAERVIEIDEQLNSIVRDPKTLSRKEVAELLKQNKNIDPKIIEGLPKDLKVTSSFPIEFAGKSLLERTIAVGGVYDALQGDKIQINPLMGSIKNPNDKILIHEVVHAVSADVMTDIKSNPEDYSESQVRSYNFLKELTEDLKDIYGKDPMDLSFPYGLTNEFEFMSEYISNPKFVKWVSKQLSKNLPEDYSRELVIDNISNIVREDIPSRVKNSIEESISNIFTSNIEYQNKRNLNKPNELIRNIKEESKKEPDESIDIHKEEGLGYRLRELSNGNYEFYASKEGKPLGVVDVYKNKNTGEFEIQYNYSNKKKDNLISKILEAVVTQANKLGKTFYSDSTYLSPENIEVWESLVEKGIAERVGTRKTSDPQYVSELIEYDNINTTLDADIPVYRSINNTINESEILPKVNKNVRKFLAGFPVLTYLDDKVYKNITSKVGDITINYSKKALEHNNSLIRGIGQTATSWFNGIPRTNEELAEKRRLKGGQEVAYIDGKKVTQDLQKLINYNVESAKRVHQVLDPEIYGDANVVTFDDLTLEERQLYTELRKINDQTHETNFEEGFIDKETYDKFKGKYIARLYEEFETLTQVDEKGELVGLTGIDIIDTKLNLKVYKERKAIDQWMIDNKVTDPIYLTVNRMIRTQRNIAVKNYAKFVNENNASDVEKKGYTQLKGKIYGDLDGKYVPYYIAEDFKGYFFANKYMDKIYDAFKGYDRLKARQFLKKFHTVYNPIVQIGNFMSNHAFAFASGINVNQLWNQLPKAAKDIKEEGSDYMYLVENGIIGSNILTNDLVPLTEPAQRALELKEGRRKSVLEKLKKLDKKASEVYAGSDDIMKLSAFKALVGTGYTREEALQRVFEGFQNYATVGKVWDLASKTPIKGNAYIKFQADLMRIMKNAVVKRPLTTAAFLSSIRLFTLAMSELSGEDEEERRIRENRPFIPKMNLGFTEIPLVFKMGDKEINISRYMSPYYDYDVPNQGWLESTSRFLPFQFEQSLTNKGETVNNLANQDVLLGALFQVFQDRDFRGKSIADPDATKFKPSSLDTTEKLWNQIDYVARGVVPLWSTGRDAYLSYMYGEDYYGRTKGLDDIFMSKLIKVQTYGKPELQKTLKQTYNSIVFESEAINTKLKSLESRFSKEIEQLEKRVKSGKLDQDRATNKYNKLRSDFEKRYSKIMEGLVKKQEEMNSFLKEVEMLKPELKTPVE